MRVSEGAITIELRKSTIRDGWLRLAIFEALRRIDGKPDRETEYHVFARVCSQSAKVEGLPFALPTSADDDTALADAWANWADVITEDFQEALVVAIGKLLAPADTATGPQPLVEGVEKN